MRESKVHYLIIFVIIFSTQILYSCNAKEEKTKQVQPAVKQKVVTETPVPKAPAPSNQPPSPATPMMQGVTAAQPGVVIDVNGKTLTRQRLDQEVKKAMTAMKNQIPSDKKKEFEQNVRMRVVDGFVSRTLLTEEIGRKKIRVTDQELSDEINKIKSSLPPGTTMEDFLKKNKINQAKMNDDVKFAIQINKLVSSSMKEKVRPSEKEIEQFYQKNKEKFKRPESAHARHILIAKSAGDDEKTKTEKKNKAEALRKQLIEGADFVELAKQNSDCPSKQNGGDLGVFAKGQMVKPFEDAAFSQNIKDIGPVVETDFGYHIIQVLERKPAQTMDLDNTVKGRISSLLEQKKLQEAFAKIMKGLKEKATIKVHEKI